MHATRTRQAGSCHGGVGSKADVAGERRGTHSNGGGLGAAMHWRLSKLCGLGALIAKSVSLPNAWLLLFLRAHPFTGCRTSYPTLPLFPVFTNLIPLSDIFEVKISRLDER